MRKRWVLRETDEQIVAALSEELQLAPLLARVLCQRGLQDPAEVKRFLAPSLREDLPSPFLMRGMRAAVDRLAQALERADRKSVV